MRILIVNPFGIGDVLFSTPLIRAVRLAFPDSYLAYLCNARTESILQANPHLDELFVYEKDDFLQIWGTSRWQGFLYLRRLVEVHVVCIGWSRTVRIFRRHIPRIRLDERIRSDPHPRMVHDHIIGGLPIQEPLRSG